MKNSLKTKPLWILIALATLVISCGQTNEKTIQVVATPVPHAVILERIVPLLEKEGYQLKIQIVNDYITPNMSLTTHSADANFFQHKPYLHYYNNEHNTNILSIADIHIEPIGLYSKRLKKELPLIDQLKDGDVIIMGNSASDQGRLLFILQDAGLITLAPTATTENASLEDIQSYAKNFTIRNDIAPEFLVSMYQNDEASLILINGNFALDAGLNPLTDAILLESSIDNPYVNILAVLPENKDSPKIKALVDALTSPEVAQFLIDTYQGAVLPANY